MSALLRKFGNSCAALCAALILTACVNATLSQQDTQADLTQTSTTYDPLQRQQAVDEIRAKAESTGTGIPTNAYTAGNGSTVPFSEQEQAQKIKELEFNAVENELTASDAELAAKQRSIRELRSQARTHYNNALKRIEN